MPPATIEVTKADDWRDVVHQAVQALVEGQVVAFPTETVYGLAASALHPAAVERLMQIKGRATNHPMALAIKSADDALDYVPDMSPLAKRLARRCWPGPVTLVLDVQRNDGLVQRLPDLVRQVVVPSGSVGLRVPGHQLPLDVLELLTGPMVLTSANRTGQPDSKSADDVIGFLDNDVDLVLDDGVCQYGLPSSVVRVRDNHWEMLREGVVTADALRRLASYTVVLICTGNTCRSPMAEALCRKQMADALGCTVESMDDHGVVVLSAGIAAMAGSRPSPEAVTVMTEYQLDITKHAAQPLTERLARHADIVLTMTRGHRHAIVTQWPELADKTFVLCQDGGDVSDPIGGPAELYRQCAEQINDALKPWIKSLDWKPRPGNIRRG